MAAVASSSPVGSLAISPGGSLWSRSWNARVAVPFGQHVFSRTASIPQITCRVQMGTKLKVADNSGAKIVGCIGVMRNGKGIMGDVITCSVKETTKGKRKLKSFETDNTKVKKGDVVRAVIVRACWQRRRPDGTHIRFDENACVLITKEGEPIGTRVYGPVASELRAKKFTKILSLAEAVV